MVDILAVCISATEVSMIQAKTTGKELTKREITLVDRSGVTVSCTLWGREAIDFQAELPCVLVLKNARVSDFGGACL
jgi:replication factor A1